MAMKIKGIYNCCRPSLLIRRRTITTRQPNVLRCRDQNSSTEGLVSDSFQLLKNADFLNYSVMSAWPPHRGTYQAMQCTITDRKSASPPQANTLQEDTPTPLSVKSVQSIREREFAVVVSSYSYDQCQAVCLSICASHQNTKLLSEL
eukprot:5419803-Amphidinium_carterae.1